jgi:hypothetical protein
MHVILHNPSAGRPSVKSTFKVLAVEHHRIFYRAIDGTIYVVRIMVIRMFIIGILHWVNPFLNAVGVWLGAGCWLVSMTENELSRSPKVTAEK